MILACPIWTQQAVAIYSKFSSVNTVYVSQLPHRLEKQQSWTLSSHHLSLITRPSQIFHLLPVPIITRNWFLYLHTSTLSGNTVIVFLITITSDLCSVRSTGRYFFTSCTNVDEYANKFTDYMLRAVEELSRVKPFIACQRLPKHNVRLLQFNDAHWTITYAPVILVLLKQPR